VQTDRVTMYGLLNFNTMKKSILLLLTCFSLVLAKAQTDSSKFSIPIKNWNLKLVGLNNFHPTYLADPLGIRFEVNSQTILYSDFDYEDLVNEDGSYVGKLMINPGVRFSLLKLSPKNNPNIGIEADLGVTAPTFMRAGNHDLIGIDGIYYFAIAGKPFEWLSLRFSKHHICTHIGDEYDIGNVNSPIDFDPRITQLPVRDDFIFSAAIKPLYFLGNEAWNVLQVYGEIGWFDPGVDFLGSRQNKPNQKAYMSYQGGLEFEYYFKNHYAGGVYAASNVSAYQLNAFSPNLNVVGGYIFPQERNKRRLRIGLSYYNGRSLSNQFYNRKERFVSFLVAMDV
jgi:hypothetical protein